VPVSRSTVANSGGSSAIASGMFTMALARPTLRGNHSVTILLAGNTPIIAKPVPTRRP
jgi:hypothetical protein